MQLLKTTLLLGFCLCMSFQSIGQEEINEYIQNGKYSNIVLALNRLEAKKVNISKNAETVYQGLGFAKAANMFKASSDLEAEDRALWTKLANAARLNANYEEAVYWYSKTVSQGPLPEDLLHYAQSLQAVGNCEEAIKWYRLYNESPVQQKVAFVENCSELDQFTSFDQVTINSPESLNTGKLDFSARPFADGVVFTSNRKGGLFSWIVDTWTNKGFTDLYFAKKDGNTYLKPQLFKGVVNGKFHDGAATFSNDNSVMFFTRNNSKKKVKSEVVNLKIYKATLASENNWNAPEELPFNGEDFSSCHPTVSQDGNTMYFASDRPGGFGGMDIYKSSYANGTWSQPVNCGASINTAGNEVFPFLTAEGDLAFSSNGHPGMGGLDVYVARQEKPNSNNWNRIVNAGKPFNSMKDDFGFYMNADNTNGYISSSRVGGENNDDIIEWNSEDPVEFFPILSREQEFCVVDVKTGKSLSNAMVNVDQMDKNGKSENSLNTNKDGKFSLTVLPDTKLSLALSKNGYEKSTKEIDITSYTKPEEECIAVEMKKVDVVMISGTIVNLQNTKMPIANATVTLYNSCTKKEKEIASDKMGRFNFEVACGCDYDVSASKASFDSAGKSLKAKKINCNGREEIVIPLSKPAPKAIVPTFAEVKVSEGMLLPLKNINYDYNKSNIRPDAAKELDLVVAFMKKYPSVSVELGSHTDARGNADYNLNLSASRANSAQNYIISKGIAKDRIFSRGYGESQLLNDCIDSSKCSDEQHEINRRTQVKVIKL